MNNKMKDYDAKFEEWREVGKEYFAKELEKIWPNIELMKGTSSTSWRYIREIFQSSSMEV
jgi:hypothetical protein